MALTICAPRPRRMGTQLLYFMIKIPSTQSARSRRAVSLASCSTMLVPVPPPAPARVRGPAPVPAPVRAPALVQDRVGRSANGAV